MPLSIATFPQAPPLAFILACHPVGSSVGLGEGVYSLLGGGGGGADIVSSMYKSEEQCYRSYSPVRMTEDASFLATPTIEYDRIYPTAIPRYP